MTRPFVSCDVKGHTATRHQPALGACDQNGFFGEPLHQHVEYGRSALKEGRRSDLSTGVDFKRWKPPTLKPEGREFKPSNATSGVPIGSMLSWIEHRDADGNQLDEPRRRSGQVWAASWKKAGAVWVAPDDGGSAVALCTKTLDVLR